MAKFMQETRSARLEENRTHLRGAKMRDISEGQKQDGGPEMANELQLKTYTIIRH